MPRVIACLIAAAGLLVSCASTDGAGSDARPTYSRERKLEAAATFLARGPDENAEAFLESAGPEGARYILAALPDAADPASRWRLERLLLYSGRGESLTTEKVVEIYLYDLARQESPPFRSMRALDRLLAMGDEAVPALRTAAERSGANSEAARRLLDRMAEAQ